MKLNTIFIKIVVVLVPVQFCISLTMAQWVPVIPQPPDTAGIYDLRVSNNNPDAAWGVMSKWLVDEDSYLPVTNEYLPIVKTTDGGQHWETKQLKFGFAPFPSSISALDEQNVYVSGVDGNFNNFVMMSNDGGNTWGRINEEAYRLPTSFVNAVHFYDKSNGVAIGDPAKRGVDPVLSFEIYTISDMGKTWVRIQPENIPAPDSNELGGPGYYSFYGDHIWFGTVDYSTGKPHRIFHSADRGLHWTARAANLTKILFADEQNGIAYTSIGIAVTTDGGNNWRGINRPGNLLINSVAMIPDSLHFVASMRGKNISGPFETWISKDQGNNWSKIDSTENVGVIRFASNGKGYGAEFQPVDRPANMYRWEAKEVSRINHDQLVSKLLIAPSVSSDKIKISNGWNKQGKITITDMSGNAVLTHHTRAGEKETELDISNLARSQYIVRLEHRQGIAVGRFVRQ